MVILTLNEIELSPPLAQSINLLSKKIKFLSTEQMKKNRDRTWWGRELRVCWKPPDGQNLEIPTLDNLLFQFKCDQISLRGGPLDSWKSHRRRICHVMKYAWDFEIAQNSNHSVSCEISARKPITCQNSEIAQNSKRNLIRNNNYSNFEPSQNQMHMLARVIVSFDDLLSQLTIPSV